MRTAVLVLGLLAATATSVLAIVWLTQYSDQRAELEPYLPLIEQHERLAASFEIVESRVQAGYALIASAFLALTGIILAALRRWRLAAVPMIIGGVIPGFFAPQALIFSSLLLIAGALALTIRDTCRDVDSFRRFDRLSPHP